MHRSLYQQNWWVKCEFDWAGSEGIVTLACVLYLQKSLNSKSLKKVELLVRCLIVICRNFDNIPLIASCDYVNQSVGITATIVHLVCTPQHGYVMLTYLALHGFRPFP